MSLYFMYIFVLAFLTLFYEIQSLGLSNCEKKFIRDCSMEFAKVWQKGDENAEDSELLKVHCKAYQTYERCLAVTSKSCKGEFLDENRQLIADHMIVDKRSGICRNHHYRAMEKLVKANMPGEVASKMLEVETDPVEPCFVKANQECAVAIARNYIHKLKNKICISIALEELFNCFETHAKTCKAKILHDYIYSLEKFGRLILREAAFVGLLPHCEGK